MIAYQTYQKPQTSFYNGNKKVKKIQKPIRKVQLAIYTSSDKLKQILKQIYTRRISNIIIKNKL